MTNSRPSLVAGGAVAFLVAFMVAPLSMAPAYAQDSGEMAAAKRSSNNATIKVVPLPVPTPLPGQLKPVPHVVRTLPAAPQRDVKSANAAARIQPSQGDYVNAMQRYAFAEGALYQVYAAPGQVTDIMLQEGEELVGAGPIAAGDTVRWIIGDTVSGSGSSLRVHVLVKPTRGDIATNLIINTNRRTYHLELNGTPSTYMASVSWTYPQDALFALKAAAAQESRNAPVATGLDLASLNFRYQINGDLPAWRPLRAFDDGRQVLIEFPSDIATGEMPPLFVTGASGSAELVNYRVKGHFMIVDRLFSAAELRLGDKKTSKLVRIERIDPKPVHRASR
ncbi:P-type conjugative transfer protein TrbG [Sphingobium yanoikuyae]|uniref:P-type conjugative transfer protein TrbG n=1 Tax=Sphingobium yanoikuyae TaxID=13690 RepID=UPI0004E2EFF0|nr:P-type conjugative transfer protein TrbG [Sphingobium yanoikuyae]KFD26166.1 conjugal transfer protein TrbG [Sphingobium yanoikuyae]MDV3480827.1 P-type conjugative transfer protein TrbG [Sphingobium yanoikuyae]